jgi:hypothetical protein
MKKHNHPIDDFFREALEDHLMVPSEEARKAFLRDVTETPRSAKKGRNGLIILTLLLALAGTGIIIWAINSDKFSSTISTESKPSVVHATISQKESASPGSQISTDNTTNKKSIHTGSVSREQHPVTQLLTQTLKQQDSFEKPPIIQANAKPPTQLAMSQPLLQPVATEAPAGVPTPADPVDAAGISTGAGSAPDLTPMKPIRTEAVSKPPETRPDSIILPGRKSNWTPPESYVVHSDWIPTLGIYYTPEWMFNTLEGSKFISNFGIEGTFHFDRFSVRTGAGLSIGKGTNELIVEYNDFLGSYNKLDSMQFTWDDPAQQFLPKYYMTKQEVYDSLMKLDYNKVVKRYTYMQIPLIMGYDFWQTDRISIGLRVGPVMSVLLASKQLSAEYDPGNKRIVSINDISPGQISLNWQVMAGINTSFRLTKGLLLEVEPSVRYYFNSVYEKPDNSARPWSIGVRAAFVIKL